MSPFSILGSLDIVLQVDAFFNIMLKEQVLATYDGAPLDTFTLYYAPVIFFISYDMPNLTPVVNATDNPLIKMIILKK